jgi:hypothetical protein
MHSARFNVSKVGPVISCSTPVITRFKFEVLVHNNPNALLIRLNMDHTDVMPDKPGLILVVSEEMMTVVMELKS